MNARVIAVVTGSLLISCVSEEFFEVEKVKGRCSTLATMRNFTGTDGCGYLLELEDGTMLEPVRLVICGPPPQSIMTLADRTANFHTTVWKF